MNKNENIHRYNDTSLALKPEAYITFPCCDREKISVFENASGCTSAKCPRCGKFALFDFDSMTATPFRAIKDVKKLKTK